MLQELKNLADLCEVGDGVASAQFAEALERIKHDLEERSGLEAERQVAVLVRFKPKVGDQGAVGDVRVEIEVKTKVPPSRSTEIAMQLVQGELAFNNESPTEPRQGTLDEEAERNANKRRIKK